MDLLFRVAILKFLTRNSAASSRTSFMRARNGFASAVNILNAVSRRTSSRRASLNCNRPVAASSAPSASRCAELDRRRGKTSSPKRGKALFGEEFTPLYDLLKNRLIFLDGGKDDTYFPRTLRPARQFMRATRTRFEAMDALFQNFSATRASSSAGSCVSGSDKAYAEAMHESRRSCATKSPISKSRKGIASQAA